jgi:hypothetical protein
LFKALHERQIHNKQQLRLLGGYIELVAEFGKRIVIPTLGLLGHDSFPRQAFVVVSVFRFVAAMYIQWLAELPPRLRALVEVDAIKMCVDVRTGLAGYPTQTR